MNIHLEQVIAVFRLIPLCIAFWAAFRSRKLLPAFITILYVCAIVFGSNFLKWRYSTAVFSTPLAYLISWYMIKQLRKTNVKIVKE